MAVSLSIDNIHSIVGSGDFLHSFFSTISFHLEPKGWGSRFPELMNELYKGKLEPNKAQKALDDALVIKQELKALPPEKVVWEIENIGRKPPWKDYIDKSVTDLSNYHITSTNRVLMDLLIECLEYQVQTGKTLTIEKVPDSLLKSSPSHGNKKS
jgi:hypothetical protein